MSGRIASAVRRAAHTTEAALFGLAIGTFAATVCGVMTLFVFGILTLLMESL